jgi:hypothetical protein
MNIDLNSYKNVHFEKFLLRFDGKIIDHVYTEKYLKKIDTSQFMDRYQTRKEYIYVSEPWDGN